MAPLPLHIFHWGIFFGRKYFFKILFNHGRHRERKRKREAETQAGEEAGSHREPDVALDPRSPGSHPGLKVVPNPEPPGLPREKTFFKIDFDNLHSQDTGRIWISKSSFTNPSNAKNEWQGATL